MLVLALLHAASAAESTFAGAQAPGQEFGAPRTEVSAELGGSWSTGNTVSYTLNAAIAASRRWRRNQVGASLLANVGRGLADGDGDGTLSEAEREAPMVETARKYQAELRYDRFLGKRDSVYALTGTLADPFSGYDNRSHLQAGYSRALVSGPPLALVVELGADVAREDFVAGVEPDVATIYAARAMGGLAYAFGPSVQVAERVEVYENILEPLDVRVLNTASLSGKLDGALSLKLSHTLTFDNRPVEGFRPLDTTTLATLVASFGG